MNFSDSPVYEWVTQIHIDGRWTLALKYVFGSELPWIRVNGENGATAAAERLKNEIPDYEFRVVERRDDTYNNGRGVIDLGAGGYFLRDDYRDVMKPFIPQLAYR